VTDDRRGRGLPPPPCRSAALCSAALCSATNGLHVNSLHVNHCVGQTAAAFLTRALLFTLTTYLPASQAINSVVALRGIRCCIVNDAGRNCSACDLSAMNWRGVIARGESISTTCVGVSQNAFATVWSVGIFGILQTHGPNGQSSLGAFGIANRTAVIAS